MEFFAQNMSKNEILVHQNFSRHKFLVLSQKLTIEMENKGINTIIRPNKKIYVFRVT